MNADVAYDYRQRRVKIYPVTEDELDMLVTAWRSQRKKIVDRIKDQSTSKESPGAR